MWGTSTSLAFSGPPPYLFQRERGFATLRFSRSSVTGEIISSQEIGIIKDPCSCDRADRTPNSALAVDR
jgi:hypothetical protein